MKHKNISKEYINTIKLEKGCAICGYNKVASALDFHHIKGEKKGNISQLCGKNLFIEAKKCIVLCSNCHRELHVGLHSLKPLYKKMITQEDLDFAKGEWDKKRLLLFRQRAVNDARKEHSRFHGSEDRKKVAMKLVRTC